MTPFVLSQHEKDSNAFRELRETEVASVSGGLMMACPGGKEETTTVTTDGAKQDGCDEE